MMVSERVVISAIEPDDLPAIVAWRNRPDVRSGFIEYEPLSLAAQQAFMEALRTDSSRRLWLLNARDPEGEPAYHKRVRPTEDAVPIGTVGLIDIDMRNRRCEFGPLFVGDSRYRRFEYVYEAERLVLEHCFDHLGMHKVIAHVTAGNSRVVRLHRALGFQEECLLREHVFRNGRFEDVHLLALLSSAFAARLARSELAVERTPSG